MEDSLRLYRTILEFIWQSGLRLHDLRCLATYAWAITGILLSHTVHLGEWSTHRKTLVKAGSKERQFSRWLHNDKIQPSSIYRPLIKKVLLEWQGQCLYLALDSSVLWDRFVIIRLALVYRGRALPVSWTVMVSQSAMVKLADYQPILEEAAKVLPGNCRVILLADRGFVDQKLSCWLRDQGWNWRIRLKNSTWVHRADGRWMKIARLMPAKGQALFLHKVWLTKRSFGPIYLALAHIQTPDGYEKWAILSDEPTDLHTFDEFGLRFDIEENFLDDKSAGFQLERSAIRNADALARLGLILATATLYLVSSGVAVVSTGRRHCVDAHWQRGLSYFHIGWRWVSYALTHGLHLLRFIWIDPLPDPYPVFASQVQAAKPLLALSALSLEVG